MRIAQIAPLYESVPPKLYGGTERIVSYLTEELVRQKQDVTLFASGDSETKARLVPVTERAIRLQGSRIQDPLAHHIRLVELAAREADQFDILHFHLDHLHFPLARRSQSISVTTLHGRLDIPDLAPLFQAPFGLPDALLDRNSTIVTWNARLIIRKSGSGSVAKSGPKQV